MAQEDLGSWKSHQTINLTQAIYWEGKLQEGGCLYSGEKQHQTEQVTGLI